MRGVQGGSVTVRLLSSSWARVPIWLAFGLFATFTLVVSLGNLVVLGSMLIFVGSIGYLLFHYFACEFQVVIDGPDLVISRGDKSVKVPVSAIRAVDESHWSKPKSIALSFDSDIGFGRVIEFVPEHLVNPPWAGHPTAIELKMLAGLKPLK